MSSAAEFLPTSRSLKKIGEAAETCRPNAVKHFKWRPKGKRRLHQTPRAGEIEACKPWLQAEVEVVNPLALQGAAR